MSSLSNEEAWEQQLLQQQLEYQRQRQAQMENVREQLQQRQPAPPAWFSREFGAENAPLLNSDMMRWIPAAAVGSSNAGKLLLARLIAFESTHKLLAIWDPHGQVERPLCFKSRAAKVDLRLIVLPHLLGWAYPNQDVLEGRRLLRPSDVKAKMQQTNNFHPLCC